MKKRKPIFYDTGKRWKKIKLFSIVLIFFITLFATFSVVSYITSPFGAKNTLIDTQVDAAIEEINAQERPVLNQGTFLTIENVYGEEYIKRFGEEKKQVVLSFDDGPDPEFTPKILEVLSQENVPGTFFVTGLQTYKYPDIVREIIDQGSDIGTHTFSHFENPNEEELSQLEFVKELDFTEKIFVHYFGYKPLIFRIPYVGVEDRLSYNSLQYIGEAYKRGFTISAPTVDSLDWLENTTKEEVIKRATTSHVRTVVILFHDAGGERTTTIESLPEIIKFYKMRGYEFTTISALARQNNLPVSAEASYADKLFAGMAFFAYDTYKQAPNLLRQGFAIGFVVVLIHTFFILTLALSGKINLKRKTTNKKGKYKCLISIIIPMHNEEKSIKATIRSVLRNSYKNIEIIVINNGSSDNSLQEAQKIKNKKVTILNTQKSGKHLALNLGLKHAKGKILVCIDADTRLRTSSINKIVQYFTDKEIGAVAGHLLVGNPNNFLTRIQNIEYIVAQSIEKRISDIFGVVPIVPGAFGAWRKSAIIKAGRFNKQTHAEDYDLSLRIIKKGYRVKYADKAVAYTEAPTSLNQLFTQRLRWNFGNLQVIFKHKDALFNKKYGFFGIILFPRYAFLQIPSILLSPLVDILIIYNLLIGERTLTLIFLGLYLLIQFSVILVASILSPHKKTPLFYFVFLRFPYTQIMYIVLFTAILNALRGEIIAWTKLQHTGRLTIAKN